MSKASETFLNHLRKNEVLVSDKKNGEHYNDEIPSHVFHIIDGMCHALDKLEKTELSRAEIMAEVGYHSDDLSFLETLNKVIWKYIESHPDYIA